MSSMSYCRHENTAHELAQVIELWDEFDPDEETEYELRARARIIDQVIELAALVSEQEATDLRLQAKEARKRA